jgi:hypothetical protein
MRENCVCTNENYTGTECICTINVYFPGKIPMCCPSSLRDPKKRCLAKAIQKCSRKHASQKRMNGHRSRKKRKLSKTHRRNAQIASRIPSHKCLHIFSIYTSPQITRYTLSPSHFLTVPPSSSSSSSTNSPGFKLGLLKSSTSSTSSSSSSSSVIPIISPLRLPCTL